MEALTHQSYYFKLPPQSYITSISSCHLEKLAVKNQLVISDKLAA